MPYQMPPVPQQPQEKPPLPPPSEGDHSLPPKPEENGRPAESSETKADVEAAGDGMEIDNSQGKKLK